MAIHTRNRRAPEASIHAICLRNGVTSACTSYMIVYMQQQLNITLCALSYELLMAWQHSFRGVSGVTIVQGDILQHSADAIISPANCFGYMDGGIDLVFSQFFGWHVEDRVREILLRDFDGELPVGQAILVETDHARFPRLICAPTMRVPTDVAKTAHAFLAFRAALRLVRDYNKTASKPIESIACPGLCTGEGRMPYDRCARQMRAAYDAIILGKIETKGGLAGAVRGHIELVR
jgi:O-acetyl-ADP-ribose deacetylase (regulator of RNase III)